MRSTIERLRDFDSALLANVLDFVDPTPPEQCYLSGEIQSVTPTLGPTVGIAVTVQIDSSTPGGQWETDPYWQTVEKIEAMDEPAVLIIQAVGSRPDHECVAGDGMAKTLYSAGCVGLVTNGRVRDVDALHTVPFSVHSKGRCVQHCAYRFKAVDVPVEIGGLTISPGDIIHAGADGVLRLASASIDRLIEAAPKLVAVEHEVHAAFRRTDLSIKEKQQIMKEVYERYGFGER
jgi:regulator of RNase E activity RraA